MASRFDEKDPLEDIRKKTYFVFFQEPSLSTYGMEKTMPTACSGSETAPQTGRGECAEISLTFGDLCPVGPSEQL